MLALENVRQLETAVENVFLGVGGLTARQEHPQHHYCHGAEEQEGASVSWEAKRPIGCPACPSLLLVGDARAGG